MSKTDKSLVRSDDVNLIDLTLTVSESIPSFSGSPAPQFIDWSDIEHEGYNLELLFPSSHTGTYLDAPFHFVKTGLKIHQIPLDRLVGKDILIKLKKIKNTSITKSDILLFEKKNGKIPNHASIFFFTEWPKNLKQNNYFTENPGLDAASAKYLTSKKKPT